MVIYLDNKLLKMNCTINISQFEDEQYRTEFEFTLDMYQKPIMSCTYDWDIKKESIKKWKKLFEAITDDTEYVYNNGNNDSVPSHITVRDGYINFYSDHVYSNGDSTYMDIQIPITTKIMNNADEMIMVLDSFRLQTDESNKFSKKTHGVKGPYLLFCAEKAQKYAHLDPTERRRKIAKKWESLDADAKEYYHDLSKKDIERFKKEYKIRD